MESEMPIQSTDESGKRAEARTRTEERIAGEDLLPEFLTVAELAEIVRIDKKTIYAAIKRGEIPGARRVGNVIRVHRRTVLDWWCGRALPCSQ
jgi:excisionase family DNA binding protein